MKRIILFALAAIALSCAALGQDPDSTAGPGAPTAQSPVPDCVHFKHYRDTLTGNLWQSSGVPCTWVQAGGAGYTGVTSDGNNGLNVNGGVTYGLDSSKQVAAAYRTPGIWVSPYCPTSNATCIKIYGDGQKVVDATSTSTTTVTCPDCNFTSADVGKVAWATTNGSGAAGGAYNYTTFVCPQTTISTVNSATSVTLANTCTASGSANVVFYWGHDDGATLAAINPGCNVVHMASAATYVFDGQPFLYTNTCSDPFRGSMGSPGASLVGDGFGASQLTIEMTPNFNWSPCPSISGNGCIASAMRVAANILVHASGLTAASNTNCANGSGKIVFSTFATSSEMLGIDVAGVCPGESGMIGVLMNNTDEQFNWGGAQDVGTIACEVYGPSQAMSMVANDCINPDVSGGYGLEVLNGAGLATYSSALLQNVYVTGSGTSYFSYNSQYTNGGTYSGEVASGAKFVSYGDTFTSSPFRVDSGATHITTNSTYAGYISNAGTVTSGGGNKLGALPVSAAGTLWTGTGVLFGSCRGTATSSATLGLYGLGQFSTYACTSTTTTAGVAIQQVPLSGSAFNLNCAATHAGVSASSGVVTVLINGSSSYTGGPLTCTLGTGTSCQDNSHYVVPAVGDVISIQFTTQASEVLAGVSCSLLAW